MTTLAIAARPGSLTRSLVSSLTYTAASQPEYMKQAISKPAMSPLPPPNPVSENQPQEKCAAA